MPIKGYEGIYEVSNTGKVKALGIIKLFGNRMQNRGDKILKPSVKKRGYLQVNLQVNNKGYHVGIHCLVAKMFIANPENKPTVNHKDGNKSNNSVGNLEWATNLEQITHADLNGFRNIKGENSKKSKLTNEAVFDIRNSGLTDIELAKKYSVYNTCINKVRRKLTWRHI